MKREIEHYYMCNDCAVGMGGHYPPNHVCTMTMGKCPYCGKKGKALIPWVDFNWPEDRDLNIQAALARD